MRTKKNSKNEANLLSEEKLRIMIREILNEEDLKEIKFLKKAKRKLLKTATSMEKDIYVQTRPDGKRGGGAKADPNELMTAAKKAMEVGIMGIEPNQPIAQYAANIKNAVVSDIGGTTTDISLINFGTPNVNHEGSVIGGLLGAGIALSSSRGKDRFWAVPAGGTAGALIGCQVDGG